MSRAGMLYLLMILVLVVGLWGILSAGGNLKAPHCLAGTWQIIQSSNSVNESPSFEIAQSGRFVCITSKQWHDPLSLRWEGETVQDDTRIVRLKGHRQYLTVTVLPEDQGRPGRCAFVFSGQLQATWRAEIDPRADVRGATTSTASH